MLYKVTHITRYVYEAPVSQCLNEVRVTPRAFMTQQVKSTSLTVDPTPAFVYGRKDYFGNDVFTFGVFENHDKLIATATSLVDVASGRPRGDAGSVGWKAAAAALSSQPDEACLQASEFKWESPYVPISPELDAYGEDIFAEEQPLLQVVTELSQRIHKDFKYEPQSTSIDLPLPDVLKNRRGVCQDFAHVMIGVLRSHRLAARYVSGYVRSGKEFQGAQASHAWVSVFFPGAGWIDFDPTNNMMPSDTHVTLGWGRDYGDVAPVKGVTLGGRGQDVEVEVYVKPA